jgi:hypothetical protein
MDIEISGAVMESDFRYYQRRAATEWAAAERAITPQARTRRLELAKTYRTKAAQCAQTETGSLLLV